MRLPWNLTRRRRSSRVEGAVRAAALRVYREVAQRPSPDGPLDSLSEGEVERALASFRSSVGDLRAQEAAIADGDIDRHLGVRAFNVKMDVINQCNIRCKMCHFNDPAYSYVNLPKKEMTVEDFARIAEEVFPYTGDLSLSASTEPLLHGHFRELLEIVARYRVPHVMMHTNALLMTEAFAEEIVRGGMNHISISIDGATKETYETIRRGGKFDKLLGALDLLNAAKARHGSETPRIAFTMVVMRSNIEELPLLVELAARYQVAAVGAVHMVPLHEHLESETLNAFPEVTNAALARARELGVELGIHTNLPPPFDVSQAAAAEAGPDDASFSEDQPEPTGQPAQETQPEGELATVLAAPRSVHPELARVHATVPVLEKVSCHFPWRFITINTDGDVSPCGWWYHQPTMGNLFRERFVEILRSEDYRALRAEHRCGKLREVCRACPSVGMGSVDSEASFEGVS